MKAGSCPIIFKQVRSSEMRRASVRSEFEKNKILQRLVSCFSRELVFPPRPSIIELIQLEEEKVLMDELGKSRQQRLAQPDAEAA